MSALRDTLKSLLGSVTRAVAGPLGPVSPPSKKVAIIVPMSTRDTLTEEEEISLRQLRHHLGSRDKFLIVPEGSKLDLPDFHVMPFPRRFFGSAAAHGRMLNAPDFYQYFSDYEFIFFFHLDSLAFSDQLDEWCAAGIDYIGPPWINCADSPWVDRPRVGNGGFTLLRMSAAFKVFENRYRTKPMTYWLDRFTQNATPGLIALVEKTENLFPLSILSRRLLREWRETEDPSSNNRNNDVFWSDMAVRFLPEFRVATLEQGLQFAFETSPSTCFEMNGGVMPFGCHAWGRYDRAFWEPHIVPPAAEKFVRAAVAETEESFFRAVSKTA
jgi:Protein of unknown function (DUF5672)